MPEVFVGVDVAKGSLDIHHPGRGTRRIGNSPAALRAAFGSFSRRAVATLGCCVKGCKRRLSGSVGSIPAGLATSPGRWV
ncbi:MAG: hypothetical protein ACLFU0_09100 [Alphaproteobacteria bacterium]